MDNKDFPIKSKAVWLKDVINSKYNIPAYQRPYEWGEKNIDDFLNSIFDGYKEQKPVFFGTIQLNKEDNSLDIVDGQQRITTFLLFLNVLQEQVAKAPDQQQNTNYYDVIDDKELKKALVIDITAISVNNPSRYALNKKILFNKTREYHKGSGEKFFTKVIEFVLNKVYFIRLETEKMNLADVVPVF